ncbi:hypothetical protein [Streptomyces sp. NPDC088847]|uniref:hypothetical protein n=1 Tax=Streptomyces sp. NPDC088847 TaxID=3365909 RepID=UPI00381EF564
MSASNQPSWTHPLLRLHHRNIDKRVAGAQTAANELGIELQSTTIQEALAYKRGDFPRTAATGLLVIALAFALWAGFVHAKCTPGGMLSPSPADDCAAGTLSWAEWWHTVLGFDLAMLFLLSLTWIVLAAQGMTIVGCAQPLYPLLKLLTHSAAVARANSTHTQAVKLGRLVSNLGMQLRGLARNAASDFGNRRALRNELTKHLTRVDAAFIETANGLAGDREASARRLGELSAQAANNIAAGRFTAVLPADIVAGDVPLEPDQLDGRRLGTACLLAAASVTAVFLVLSPLGAPGELLVPLAFLVMVYALLAFRYGLSEATRLTRSIGGFFSANPPP